MARRYPEVARAWLAQLDNISQANTLNIFNRINCSRISDEASKIARSILNINKHRLLNLRETLP